MKLNAGGLQGFGCAGLSVDHAECVMDDESSIAQTADCFKCRAGGCDDIVYGKDGLAGLKLVGHFEKLHGSVFFGAFSNEDRGEIGLVLVGGDAHCGEERIGAECESACCGGVWCDFSGELPEGAADQVGAVAGEAGFFDVDIHRACLSGGEQEISGFYRMRFEELG